MITDSFDNKSRPLITAKDIYSEAPRDDNKVCLVTFSGSLFKYIQEHYELKEVFNYKTTNGPFSVHSFELNGKTIMIYRSIIGAAVASTLMYEIASITGCYKFVFFGSCGVLNESKCRGKVIVPSEAYRDEGISYHYAEPADYIEVRNHARVASFLKENDIEYVEGRVWTTDAFYMETQNKVAKRKAEGVLAVEMETSGVEAVARYHNIDNFHFIFPADSLDDVEWSRTDFGGDKELLLQIKSFSVATKFALALLEK